MAGPLKHAQQELQGSASLVEVQEHLASSSTIGFQKACQEELEGQEEVEVQEEVQEESTEVHSRDPMQHSRGIQIQSH